MHEAAIRAQVQFVYDELQTKNVSPARVKELSAELDELDIARKNLIQARKYAGSASPSEWGLSDHNPGDFDNGLSFKGFAPGMDNQIRPTSLYQIDKAQTDALQQAARQNTSFKVQVGSKGIESGFLGGARSKAALGLGGLNTALPPIQQPGPGGFWGLPYELTRVANFLPNVAMDGPGIAYFKHTANAAEAAYTAEGATKPDISPTITETYVRPAKVAGRVLLTHEIVQDAGDAFSQMLVTGLPTS